MSEGPLGGEKPQVYQKHNSFVEVRHHIPRKEDLDRIMKVRTNLEECSLSDYAKRIVRQACEELINPSSDSKAGQPFTLQSYVAEEMNRLPENELPRYLFYRYRYEIFPARKVLDDFPPCLQVEPASVCNYRCVFCYQVDPALTKKSAGHMGMMPLDTFKRVVDQAEGQCDAITLASRGEPLICPEIEAMLQYSKGKFLALKMNTNAWYLDEAKSHSILEADLNTLVFSADAASEPAYSQLRVGGKLDRILKNIEQFQNIRAKQYPECRTITRVSGVRVPGTPHLDQMEKFWGDLVDQVAFVQYNPWENIYEQSPRGITETCSDLWRRMFVWWDGIVNPCDVDYLSTLAVGNVLKQDLSELWKSEGYSQLREKHLDGNRSGCSPCDRCSVV